MRAMVQALKSALNDYSRRPLVGVAVSLFGVSLGFGVLDDDQEFRLWPAAHTSQLDSFWQSAVSHPAPEGRNATAENS